MDDPIKNQRTIPQAENVPTSDGRSSVISSLIFFLICFVPVFSTVMFGAVDNATWIFIFIFWALIVLLWLADAWQAGGFLVNSSSLQIPLIGFLLIGLVQLLPLGGSVDALPGVAVTQTLSLDPYSTRFFVIRLTVYIVFFAACLAFINNEKRLKKVVLLVIVFGSFMAFFGVLQRLANPDGIYGLRETRQSIPFGPFVNQHHFASFMQMTGGVALGLLFGAAKDKKILLAIAVVIMGVATVLTSSRGGLLGFAAVLAFVTGLNFLSGRWSAKGRRTESPGLQQKIAIGATIGALVVIIFGVVLFLGGDESLLRGIGAAKPDGDLSSGRFGFWRVAIHIFAEHPIIGAGFEAFGVAFTKYDLSSGQFRVEQAHNEYLQTLADAGIAGFLCLAAFIYLLFKKGLATIVNSDGLRRDAAVGALAGCFGILIHSFFDFPLRTWSNSFIFLLLASIATVAVKTKSEPTRRRRKANAP